MKIFLSLLLSFLISTTVFAQTQKTSHWEFAGWYGGGCFPNIEIDRNVRDRVYLTSDVAGIWRSDDLGENWYFVTQGLGNLMVAAVAIAPSDSNVLYAATGGGIYISRDAGASWSATENTRKIKFKRPQSYRPLAVSVLNPLHICAGTSQGELMCSDNGGKNWNVFEKSQQKSFSVIMFDNTMTKVFAGGSSGLQVYDLTTQTWSAVNADLEDVTDLAISIMDPRNMYVAAHGEMFLSTDKGQSWQKAKGQHSGKIFRLNLSEGKTTQIFAAENKSWNGKILVSNDEGATWDNVVATLTTDQLSNPTRAWANRSGKLTALRGYHFGSDVMFRSDWWGVFRSDDGGKTWNEKIIGAPNTVGSDINVTENSLLVATMDNGLLKSSDNGKSYHALFPSDKYDDAQAGHVWRVIVPTAKKIIATSSLWGKQVNQVIVSDDDGEHFKIVRDGLPEKRPKKNTMWGEGLPRALAVDTQNPDMMYLGIDGDDGGGLFISKNGGYKWERSSGQPDSLRIYNGLVVDVKDSNTLYWAACGKKGGIYRTNDRGLTWKKVFSRSDWVFDLHMSSDGTLYAAAASKGPAVYVSKNQGDSWKKAGDFLPSDSAATDAIVTSPKEPNIVVVSTVHWGNAAPQKIYLSRNAGKSWEDISGDLPPGAGTAAVAFDSEGEYLYISRYAGSVYRIRI
ncbi:MAG: hypothetical protein H6754_06235 [Candidatus Omnitrophica bacterium]|nr:hypothetical protein [Candidatus Omnitrophota bacterium]